MTKTLQDLRSSIDDIDRKIHSLLVERANVVAAIGKVKSLSTNNPSQGNLRLDRECEIIKTRIREHKGQFPVNSLIRIWREIISASLRIEGDFTIAAHARKSFASFPFFKGVYDYFGSYTDVRVYSSPSAAMKAVKTGKAAVAVLPFPSGDKPWWTAAVPLKIALRLPITGDKTVLSSGAFVLTKDVCRYSNDDISVIRVFSSLSVAELRRSFASFGMVGAVCENDCPVKEFRCRCRLFTVPGRAFSNDGEIRKFAETAGIIKAEVLGWYPILK